MRNYLCCIDPLQFFDDIHFETCRPGRTAALRAGNLPTASPLGRLDGRPDSESARASAASRVTQAASASLQVELEGWGRPQAKLVPDPGLGR
jgi:hypothetical protein